MCLFALALLLAALPERASGQGGATMRVSSLQFSESDKKSGDLRSDELRSVRLYATCWLSTGVKDGAEIAVMSDGTINSDCDLGREDRTTGTIKGKVDFKTRQVTFSAQTTREYRLPFVITDGQRGNKEIGWGYHVGKIQVTYQATGTLTSDKQAKGTVSFSYACSLTDTDLKGDVPYGPGGHCAGSKAKYDEKVGTDTGTATGTTTWTMELEPASVPLIFVPGIAGSVLQLDGIAVNPELWPTAIWGSRTNLGLEIDGETAAVKGAKIIAPDIVRSVAGTKVYAPLIQALEEQGYEENVNLFIFPYDWRLDNTQQVLKLAAKVDEVLEKTKAPKVNILTHSMGGLIGRGYVNSAGKSKVETLITMSLPFYGSPVAYYAVVDGYSFGNATVRAELIKVLGQNWPAPYQLGPRKPFIIDSRTNQPVPVEDSYRLKYKGFKDVNEHLFWSDSYEPSDDNVWTFNPGLVRRANDFHALLVDRNTLEEKPLPDGVKHYAIIGHGVRTLSWYRMRDAQAGESFVELGSRQVVLEPQFLDGDGTVPLWGLDLKTATRKYYVSYLSKARSGEHTELTANPTTHSIIKNILEGNPPDANNYRPPNYVDLNTFLYFFEGIDFTLHSDAHLSIVDEATGRKLGINDQGGIDEEILTGSFLSIDGVEYASLAHLPSSYKVSVNGIHDGQFRLTVNVAKGGQTTSFEYPEVPVKKGTVAQFSVTPNRIGTTLPPMQVVTDGQTTSVTARLAEAKSAHSVPSSPISSEASSTLPYVLGGGICALLAGAIVAGALLVTRSRPARPLPPPPPPPFPPSSWDARARAPRPTDLPERERSAKPPRPTDLPK